MEERGINRLSFLEEEEVKCILSHTNLTLTGEVRGGYVVNLFQGEILREGEDFVLEEIEYALSFYF
jgi:hypothetical protein